MNRHKFLSTLLLLPCVFAAGCGAKKISGTKNANNVPAAGAQRISGVVEKGPFAKGATVTAYALGTNLERGDLPAQSTQVGDDAGTYVLVHDLNARFVEVEAAGRYYDEVSDAPSDDALGLRAYVDLSVSTTVNVNVLTTLSAGRIKELVGEGLAFADAKRLAQHDVLAAFNIEADDVGDFDHMTIAQGGDGNAILLAASAILQGRNPTAAVQDLIARLTTDLAADGRVNDASLTAALIASGQALDLDGVRANLMKKYAALGVGATIPYFDDFVMSDGVTLNGKIPPTVQLRGVPTVIGNLTSTEIAVALIGKHLESTAAVTVTTTSGFVVPSPEVLTFAEGGFRRPQKVSLAAAEHGTSTSIVLGASADGLVSASATVQYRDEMPTLETVVADVAGTHGVGAIGGMVVAPSGDVFATGVSANQVFRIAPTGDIFRFSGTGVRGNDDGPASTATFNAPNRMGIAATGRLFVQNTSISGGSAVRLVEPSGEVIDAIDLKDVLPARALGVDDQDRAYYIASTQTDPDKPASEFAVRQLGSAAKLRATFAALEVYDAKAFGGCYYVAGVFVDDTAVACVSETAPPTTLLRRSELNDVAKTTVVTSIAADKLNFYFGTATGIFKKALSGGKLQPYCALATEATARAGRCGGNAAMEGGVNFLGAADHGVLYFFDGRSLVKIIPTL